jgi:GH15 family glucan-1,4-alpha-glucosidase
VALRIEDYALIGLAGERRLTELELSWLPGYEASSPVRIGNAASEQFQLDVYGEVIDAMYHANQMGMEPVPASWHLSAGPGPPSSGRRSDRANGKPWRWATAVSHP